MSCAVFAREGLTGKINRSPRLEPPNEILGCAQNQTAGLAPRRLIGLTIKVAFPKWTEVELGSITSLRLTGSDISAVDLDLSA